MKLLRYGPLGEERPGMMDAEGAIRNLSGVIDDVSGTALDDASLAKLRAIDPATLPVVGGNPRLGPCVGSVGKFVCIGLNYADHAAESGMNCRKNRLSFSRRHQLSSGPTTRLKSRAHR